MSDIGDPMREMASALVDGEATGFECRRVLDGLADPQVSGLLARHYTVRSVLRRESPALCPPALTASILDAIAREEPLARGAVRPRWQGWAGGVAVAASVCLVAVVGSRALTGGPGVPAGAPAIAAAQPLGVLGAPAARAGLAPSGAVPVGFETSSPGTVGDRAAEQRLQLFMVGHAQNGALNTPQGMLPFARVASYADGR